MGRVWCKSVFFTSSARKPFGGKTAWRCWNSFRSDVTDLVGPVLHTSYNTSDSPLAVMGLERNVAVQVGGFAVNTCGQPVLVTWTSRNASLFSFSYSTVNLMFLSCMLRCS